MNDCVKEMFPERLKTLREAIGVSQEEMANRLGISRPTLTYYEAGKRLPDIQVLDAICQATGCSPGYLLGYSDAMNSRFTNATYQLGIDEEVLAVLEQCGGRRSFKAMVQMPDFWTILDSIEFCASLGRGDDLLEYMRVKLFERLASDVEAAVWNSLPDSHKQEVAKKKAEQKAILEKEVHEALKRLEEHRKEEQLKQAKAEEETREWVKKREEERFEQIKTDKFLRFQAKLNNWPAWQRYQKEAGEHDAPKAD